MREIFMREEKLSKMKINQLLYFFTLNEKKIFNPQLKKL